MDIFESLENLNVSEECFNDIINIVEDIVSQIQKVHGEPRNLPNGGLNKSAQLMNKVNFVSGIPQKVHSNLKGSTDNKYTPKNIKKYSDEFSGGNIKRATKNEAGEQLTTARQFEKNNK